MLYIGIDLGTGAAKGALVTEKGEILHIAGREYPVRYPFEGWSEQDPEDWWRAARELLAELSAGREAEIGGISFGGQMHGLVALDEHDEVIRPAILWNDGRTAKETEYLNEKIGKARLSALTANIAFAGFTAPKLLWLAENEPENFARIRKICLPKDYIAYRLTGEFTTDYSDAGGTLLLDVKNRCWSREMCEICGVSPAWLPRLCESYEVTGKVLPAFGLPNAVVTAGAGDNAAAAIGTGTVGAGGANVSLGTSGTVFLSSDRFSGDCGNALHVFPHADGGWHFLGCVLSAAGANKWWIETVLGTGEYDLPVDPATLGTNRVFFLPYLMGERSPHNDTDARGVFFGLCADTDRTQMSLAVLEGVTFALRDCVEAARKEGIDVTAVNLCGGGAKSLLWRQIVADVLNVEVYMTESEQGPSFGAALLAMVGGGAYPDVSAAIRATVHRTRVAVPNAAAVARYEKKYEFFRTLYPALKNCFAEANR